MAHSDSSPIMAGVARPVILTLKAEEQVTPTATTQARRSRQCKRRASEPGVSFPSAGGS